MKYFYYSTLIFYTLASLNTHPAQKAVINVAIADLIGNPIIAIRPDEQPENSYKNIAICGGQTNSPFSCPRLHQLLYNDIVDVIKTTLDPGYYMQLASLPSEASAKKELSRLRQKYKDITPMIQPFETGVKKFHRVMVGPFSDKDAALKKCVSIGNGCKVIQISQNNG